MYRIGDTLYECFTTHAVGGAVQDADADPALAAILLVNGFVDPEVPSVNSVGTGEYVVSASLAAVPAGSVVQVVLWASVGGVAGKLPGGAYRVSEKAVDDLHDFNPTTEPVDVGSVGGSMVTGPGDLGPDISALSTFDPSSQSVDVASINWMSVSGPDDLKADTSGLSIFDANSQSVTVSGSVDVTSINGAWVNGPDDLKADVSGLSTFDASMQSVTVSGGVDVTSINGTWVNGPDDFKADVSLLSTFDAAFDTVSFSGGVDVTSVNGTPVYGPGDLRADVSDLSTFDPAFDTVSLAGGVDIASVRGVVVSGVADFRADLSALALETTVQTAAASAASADGKLPADTGTRLGYLDGSVIAAEGAIRGGTHTLQSLAAAIDGITPGGDAQQATLLAVKTQTDRIGALATTYHPVGTTGGSHVLYAGADYRTTDGLAIVRRLENYAGPAVAGSPVTFRVLDAAAYRETSATKATVETAAVATLDGTTLVLTAELTGAQSGLLCPSPPANQRNHHYQFEATLDGRIVPLDSGALTVRKRLT